MVADVQRRLAKVPYAQDFESPYAAGQQRADLPATAAPPCSASRSPATTPRSQDRVGAALRAVSAAQAAHPEFTVGEFGDASVDKQIDDAISDDFEQALVTSLPITLLILLIAFGALVAAGVPLLLALTAVIATIGLIGPISHIGAVDSSINEVILLIGLAVGVDYSMFYLRREREERESGRSEAASLAAAAATSGRAVMISGFTVMIAMAGMYLAGAPTFQSFATGTILVVAVAVVGSLTVLPATLAWLGDRVEKGGVPIIKDQPWNAGESALWSRILNPVLRHPVISILARRRPAGGPGDSRLQPAHGEPERRDAAAEPLGDQDLQPHPGRLPGRADPGRRRGQRRRRDLAGGAGARSPICAPGRREPALRAADHDRRQPRPHRRPGRASRWPATAATRSRTAALAALRDRIIPATIGAVPGATADVTGYTAGSEDFNDTMKSHAPLVFAFVLWPRSSCCCSPSARSSSRSRRSCSTCSRSEPPTGSSSGSSRRATWSRCSASSRTARSCPGCRCSCSWSCSGSRWTTTCSSSRGSARPSTAECRRDEAVAHGIKTTAGVVTSAAVVMIAVFAIFATLSLLIFKQLGVGLAVAVLIDATIIRAVLLPATMKLLGDWNWYLPSWLEWLPHVTHEPELEPIEPGEAEADQRGPETKSAGAGASPA